MLIPALLASTLLAQGKYGAFSPTASNLQDAPADGTPSAIIKRKLEEHAGELEQCVNALTQKAPRWRFDAVGGTIAVVMDLDDRGKPTSKLRVQQPVHGNEKANDCLIRTIKGFDFGPRAWPQPLNLVAVVDGDCTVSEVGNDFIDIKCAGKFKGVYSTPPAK